MDSGFQCRDFKTGVLCDFFLVLVNRRAAEFWSNCNKMCIRESRSLTMFLG